MLSKSLKPFIWLMLLVLVVGLACNLGGSAEPAATETPEPVVPAETDAPEPVETEAPEPVATEEAASGAIDSISDARSGVIQIQAEGTFIDPEFGLQLNSAGRGSGFIIDESGLAVTNNHVVTGAALIKVRQADDTEWRNARLLGVSECSDLAVIDINGDGYAYFDWYDGPVDVGTDIYVSGYPLGDPEYTLTRGVISKADAGGESSWASVDSVIEYDANALPGNSGGPVLFADDASVVGIHYAGNQSTRQAFGISVEDARSVIEQLREGEDVHSIGINGVAVSNEDGSLTGIWVSSVASGSPADQAGVRPGDILYQLENLVLATDGTMADYCDILRTHEPDDTLSISVIRWATGEILEGQLNGRDLEVTGFFGGEQTSTDDPGTDTGEVAGSTGAYNFNASASGDIAFATDFDSGDLADWIYFLTSGSEDDFFLAVENGVLSWEATAEDNWLYLINDQIEMADVQIDVSVENLGVNQNDTSLVCRYDPDRGWYEFNIGSDGLWTILRFDVSNNTYVALYNGGSNNINMGRDVNEFTAVCSGSSLSLYINGVQTRTVTDNTLRSGLAGLGVASFDQTPVIKEFDYVIFSIP